MNAQRDPCLGLILFLLATFGGPILSIAAEEKAAPERLPPPTELVETPSGMDAQGEPLPPGAVARLGATRWRHWDLIKTVCYSQDGKRIASASFGDGAIRIWDAETGRVLHSFRLNEVSALALSEDGKRLAAIAGSGSNEAPDVWVWKEGTEKPRQLVRKTDQACCLLFREDHLWIAERGGISCWDVDRDKPIIDYKHKTPTVVSALAYCGTKPMIVAATNFGVLLLKASGEKIADAPVTRKEAATAVAVAPDGKSVAVGTDYGVVYVWSIKDGILTKELSFHQHSVGITSITYSSDGKNLICVCHAGECYRWDAVTGERVSKVIPKGAPSDVTDVSFTSALVLSADGRRLAGRFDLRNKADEHRLHSWDTANGDELSLPDGHVSAVQNMAFQSDGSFLSFSTTGDIILWNTKFEAKIRRELGKTAIGKSAALSSDGRVVLFPSDSGVEVNSLKDTERFSKEQEKLFCAAFSPEANQLVTTQLGSLGFWSVKDKSVAEVTLDKDWTYTLAFSGNGKRLILTAEGAVKDDGAVQVWNVASRRKICDLKNVQSHGPIALSPHGQIGAVWSKKRELLFFDATSGEELPTSKSDLTVPYDLAFTPDGRGLAVATKDGVRFLEPLTGRELLRLDGGQGAVRCLAFNRNGTLLATGGSDSTVLFWDLRRMAREGLVSREERMPKSPEQLKVLWIDLASTDPGTGFQCVRGFLESGKTSVTFLRDRLLPHETAISEAEQRRLLKQLADPDYKERAKAFVALKKLGRAVEPMLREAFRAETDEIMHLRLRTFLSELELEGIVTPKDDRVREMRIVQLLGLMDTPPARQLLSDLAQQATSKQLREDAGETLQRLKGLAQKD